MCNQDIRTWEAGDVPDIARIMASHPLWQHYGVTTDRAKIRVKTLLDEGESGIVAVVPESHAVMGFVLFNDHTFGDSGYVRLFGVSPDCTSRGLGDRLLDYTQRAMVANGTQRVVLLCTEWNVGARRFYERHGFVRVGILTDWVMDGTNEVIYAKHLSVMRPGLA